MMKKLSKENEDDDYDDCSNNDTETDNTGGLEGATRYLDVTTGAGVSPALPLASSGRVVQL